MGRRYTQHGRRHSPIGGSDKIAGVHRTVFGSIDGSGSGAILDPGSGDWTFETDESGTWTITIDPACLNIPSVVVSLNETATDPLSSVRRLSSSVDTVVIGTYDASGTLSDDVGFDFIAVALSPPS